jgi:hypothetical protein
MEMASTAQILANQRNAQASTGPKSPAGKSASSRNATQHGLSAAFTVLPHENQQEFDEGLTKYRTEFAPVGEHESFLVELMAQARWRLQRIERLEAEAYEEVLTEPGNAGRSPDGRILSAMGSPGNVFDKLRRYAAAAERSYHKAHRELEQSRARQQRVEAKAMDSYIRSVVFAPTPGEQDRYFASIQANLQNKPNTPSPATAAASVGVKDTGNLALRL